MTPAEFIVFVALVCNFEAPVSQVPRLVKEDCLEYYTNCAISGVDDGSKIDRIKLSNCNMKAAVASKKWGR